MPTVRARIALVMACATLISHVAQAQSTFEAEYGKRLKAYQTISPGGETPFGEQINLYTGELSFSQTDLAYEGLGPSIVINRTNVGSQKDTSTDPAAFGIWELSIPRIETLIGVQYNSSDVAKYWGRSQDNYARCTQFTSDLKTMDDEAWHGIEFVTEDGARHPMLGRVSEFTTQPTISVNGKTLEFKAVTLDNWQFGCLASTANAAITGAAKVGEAFLAVSPNGTKYWLDYLVGKPVGDYRENSYGEWITTHRKLAVLYVTRIEDRFGNAIDYHYTGDKLTSITASDGRRVDIAWRSDAPLIQSVTQQPTSPDARTWQYAYTNITAGNAFLNKVTLPGSNSSWTFSGSFEGLAAQISPAMEGSLSCTQRSASNTGGTASQLSITAPSGVKGVFDLLTKVHPRSYVWSSCVPDTVNGPHEYIVPLFVSNSLAKRTLSGPGMPTQVWNYEYPATVVGSTTSDSCAAAGTCAETSYVDITDPGSNLVRHTYSTRAAAMNPIRWVSDEGKEVKTEWYQGGTTLLRRTSYRYAAYNRGPYPSRIGDAMNLGATNTAKLERWTPLDRTQIEQHGFTFTREVTGFDVFARQTEVKGWNNQVSPNPSRTLGTAYHDHTGAWVLGQIAKTSCKVAVPASTICANTEVSRTDFDASHRPWKTYSFTQLDQTLAYNADGTVRTVTDGNGNVTTLANWSRGIPGKITHADATYQSASIDAFGQIASITDEAGATTSYGYDVMGRLASITYPTGDSTAWNATSMTFVPVASAEQGIAAGHWRQTVSTGNARKVTYFDALWQPLLVQEYDATDVAGTQRFNRFSYDHMGRTTFTAYPSASSTGTTGTHTTYDGLGRVTKIQQDSAELGTLTTSTGYLTNSEGYYTKVTNPRGYVTRTWFQSYDAPAYDTPVEIHHPGGAFTEIPRDVYGKATAITRHDSTGGVSSSRRFVYDPVGHRLCKTVEPETGATVLSYDGAGNLAWSAAGLALPNPANCDTQYVPASSKVLRSYDSRNRLSNLSFPDGNGDQTWSYWPNGTVNRVTALNGSSLASNIYTWNKRGFLETEASSQANWYTWKETYVYDANGSLSQHKQPDGEVISYSPNALGQATRATSQFKSYASGVSYFPNGAIKQFTYGNGIVHTLTQNSMGRPDRSLDAYGSTHILDDGYDYDPNGNVAAISDGATGRNQRGNRTMTYDALDRLTDVSSPMFGTTGAHYTYDVLDNLTRATAPGRDWYYCYDASWRLTNLKTGSCSGATVVGLGYDMQGNLANKNGEGYQFDYGNRLRSVTAKESYRYDGHGRRILANSWTLGNILSMYGSDGVLRYQKNYRINKYYNYVYLGGSLVGKRVYDSATGANSYEYEHTDALGSPVAVTNDSRVVIERSEYEPYGSLLNRPLTDGPAYTGHVSDAATGLSYMQQRYYDPELGRFLSVDPVTADGSNGTNFNRYWYANNNPYLFTDPDGRATCADKDCKTSTIDHIVPRSNPQPPPVNGSEGLPSAIAQRVDDGYSTTVTFQNDNPNGTSPDLPVSSATANMVESVISDAKVASVNINSTTGGKHGTHSAHRPGRAVDINRVNGQRVSPSNTGAARVQAAARSNGNVRENFGPTIMEKTSAPSGTPRPVTSKDLVREHLNHIHLSGQP